MDDTAAYKEMFRMNCATFEEIWNAIGPVIIKTADQKTITDYGMGGQTRRTIIDYHVEFEQAQNE